MSAGTEHQELLLATLSLDRAAVGILRIGVDGSVQWANPYACDKLGYSLAELQALHIWDFNPTFTPASWAEHIRVFVGVATPRVFETVHRRKTGVTFPVEVTASWASCDGVEFFLAYTRDLTDQKLAEAERTKLQAELAHAQKMDSVGRLAGGVAHDFNNMLSVILGHAELLAMSLPADSQQHVDVEQIVAAAQRSAALTRQLLAFARKQQVAPRAVDLNELTVDVSKMLTRLIGERIEVVLRLQPGLWPIHIDPAQVEQVLANLVVNARDAIAGNGTVVIETANVTVHEGDAAEHRVAPGDWVRLTVRDDGAGIDEASLDRIFEPFFTTKAAGHGTGLGLATVFGIATQNKGTVRVESAVGRGTSLYVYLPRHSGAPTAPVEVRRTTPVRGGSETVLLVEDDVLVLNLTRALLESLGYTVLATNNGHEAIAMLARDRSAVALLVSDVVMPGMGGVELARRARELVPALPILLMSGYLGDVSLGLDDVGFVEKPLARAVFAARVRECIEG